MTPPPTQLSVVVPIKDEESNIRPFYERLAPVLDQLDLNAEIIFVDDGSRDRSYELVGTLAQTDPRIKGIRFSRSFGSHAAIMAGFRWAAGDAVVMISVDLQDPPELLPTLVDRWRQGFHVVWAAREARQDSLEQKAFAWTFYRLFRRIGLRDYPASGMDFGLVDRSVIDHLKDFGELNLLITGIIVWLGFRQTVVTYERRTRASGLSKWSFGNRVKVAVDAITAFSSFPIRFISYSGLLISLVSFLYAGVIIVRRLFFGSGTIAGWPSVMVTMLFLGGVQLTMLGVLGEYLWRALAQTRGRPLYVVMDRIGFERYAEGDTMLSRPAARKT